MMCKSDHGFYSLTIRRLLEKHLQPPVPNCFTERDHSGSKIQINLGSLRKENVLEHTGDPPYRFLFPGCQNLQKKNGNSRELRFFGGFVQPNSPETLLE